MISRAWILGLVVAAQSAYAAAPETIDRMVTGTFGGYTQYHFPGNSFLVFPVADYYVLNDGSSWDSGAGSQSPLYSTVQSVQVVDGTIRYTFTPPADGLLYAGTDFSFGDHSAQGELGVTGPLVIEASLGGQTGRMQGWTDILSNEATFYDTFNYYSAPVGSRVYFETTYTLSTGAFTAALFDTEFVYNVSGFVDFTQTAPVPEAGTLPMLGGGLLLLALRLRRGRSRG
jgi:hypothetical protein